MEKKFKREVASLEKIFEFVGEFVEANSIDEGTVFTINFVVEEIFTNMVKYSPESSNDILVGLEREDRTLTIHLTDFNVEPFDLTKSAEVDIHQALKERKVGGLGIHLVRKMVDSVDYEYKDRISKVTLKKTLEK
jgi:anti-sigma regulatory factor (Ser/Thr protein kinase)